MPCAQSATRPQVVQPLEPRCVCRRCLARSGFGFLSRLERLSFVLQRNELSNTQSLPNRDSSNSFRWSLFDIGTILYSTRTHGSLRLHRYPGFPFGRASEFRSTLEVLHTSAFTHKRSMENAIECMTQGCRALPSQTGFACELRQIWDCNSIPESVTSCGSHGS